MGNIKVGYIQISNMISWAYYDKNTGTKKKIDKMYQFEKYIARTVIVILGALICGSINGQNLKKHRWENRILLMQASERSSERLQDQLNEFQDAKEGLDERKLLIYQIVGEKYRIYYTKKKESDKSWKSVDGKILKALDEGVPFKVTLIGLDGGIKFQRSEILKKKELFRIIDAMPMRLSELRNRNN